MKTLVIPDVHQNIEACQKFLDKCEKVHDKIVFLGDYFDCFHFQPHVGVKETCHWLNDTHNRLGDKAIWLSGNHEISYMEEFYAKKTYARKDYEKRYFCSGYTREKANKIIRTINEHFFNSLKLFHEDEYFIYSHAGFNHRLFQPFKSFDENMVIFETQWRNFKNNVKGILNKLPTNTIWRVGYARGGMHGFGGPLWCDWSEFLTLPNMPKKQIVGHTPSALVKERDGNYCVDTQLRYCLSIDNNQVNIIELH